MRGERSLTPTPITRIRSKSFTKPLNDFVSGFTNLTVGRKTKIPDDEEDDALTPVQATFGDPFRKSPLRRRKKGSTDSSQTLVRYKPPAHLRQQFATASPATPAWVNEQGPLGRPSVSFDVNERLPFLEIAQERPSMDSTSVRSTYSSKIRTRLSSFGKKSKAPKESATIPAVEDQEGAPRSRRRTISFKKRDRQPLPPTWVARASEESNVPPVPVIPSRFKSAELDAASVLTALSRVAAPTILEPAEPVADLAPVIGLRSSSRGTMSISSAETTRPSSTASHAVEPVSTDSDIPPPVPKRPARRVHRPYGSVDSDNPFLVHPLQAFPGGQRSTPQRPVTMPEMRGLCSTFGGTTGFPKSDDGVDNYASPADNNVSLIDAFAVSNVSALIGNEGVWIPEKNCWEITPAGMALLNQTLKGVKHAPMAHAGTQTDVGVAVVEERSG